MKKNIIFLIILITIILSNITSAQASTIKFYEAELIHNIWINKAPLRGDSTIYYQTARFFRKIGTNEFAYCTEPFNFFDSTKTYEATINPDNFTKEQQERIALIAHFGYNYRNHTDQKWYAITQFMIWQAADPEADFYFTDKLNGNRITKFQDEINEINSLIQEYQKIPSIKDKHYTLIEGNNLTLTDENNVLKNYKVDNNIAEIKDNKLIIKNLKEGLNTITLCTGDNIYNRPTIFYRSDKSQDLVETGDLPTKKISLTVDVIKTTITVTKIDSDNKTTTPSGDAKLEGTIYQLYDSSMNKLQTITIGKNCQGLIENLNFGKYYLQEIKAGEGYELDKNIYSFELTKNNPNIDLILENKVIKGKIKIYKLYGTNDNFIAEKNVSFNIYNKYNELIKTITTDDSGYAEIELPYGTYTIKQLTTTEGYEKIEPLTVIIKDQTPLTYTLKDYKVIVPNTKSINFFTFLIEWIKNILC